MTRKHQKRSKAPAIRRAAKRTAKHTAKTQYRVRNWADYNQSLVQRGSITLWISDDVLSAWQPKVTGPRPRGGQLEYTDGAIECLLMVKAVYHLTLRATEGFAQSIRKLLKVEMPIPDYSTLSRRAKTLQVALPTTAAGPIHAVLDSTGLKIYGEGEWKVRQHGYSKRRTWRKLHLNVDEATGEIQAEELTEASTDDAEMTGPLLEQTPAEVEQLSADGAYDKDKVYTAASEHGVGQVTIPPRRDAHIWQHGNCAAPPHPRDANLRRIREVGRKKWKEESGYHRRSLVETTMFRFKTIFGDHLSARELAHQKTEARIKCAALNRMTGLGMPESYRVV
jgi:transposase